MDADFPPIVEEKDLALRKPVRLAEQEYDKLHLREPTAEELAKASREPTDVDMLISLVHQVAAVPRTVAARLSQRDLQECGRFFGQFAPRDPSPSGESSPT
jgi:hypothetical protein